MNPSLAAPVLFRSMPGDAMGGSHGKRYWVRRGGGSGLFLVCGGADAGVDWAGLADAFDAGARGGGGDGGGARPRVAGKSGWAIAGIAGTEERGMRFFWGRKTMFRGFRG